VSSTPKGVIPCFFYCKASEAWYLPYSLLCVRKRRKTSSSAVARIADHIGCQWPSRSSKVDNFHFIGKSICNFLSMINSNLGHILHCLATVHPWQTDDGRQTDGQTDDNHDNSSPLLNYGLLKIQATHATAKRARIEVVCGVQLSLALRFAEPVLKSLRPRVVVWGAGHYPSACQPRTFFPSDIFLARTFPPAFRVPRTFPP